MSTAETSAALVADTVQFVSDGQSIRAYLARPPTAARPLPAVLIIHEWWGLTDHMKDLARRFAKEGYAALVPDLYARQGSAVTTDANEAAKLMSQLSSQHALRDLNAATAYLTRQAWIEPSRIGVVGFCMGGTLALTTATHNSDVKAAVIFYGKVPPIETLDSLLCPILFHHGAQDGWVTGKEVDTLRQGLTQYGKRGEVVSYPAAGHAFFNDARPDAYHPASAAQAWQRTLRFFTEHLR